MARKVDHTQVKKVLLEGLREFSPEVQIEQCTETGYLHILIISDAFETYSLMKRHNLVWDVLEKALFHDAIYPTITRLSPVTQAEFMEDLGYSPAPRRGEGVSECRS